jgi:hypothetical protein
MSIAALESGFAGILNLFTDDEMGPGKIKKTWFVRRAPAKEKVGFDSKANSENKEKKRKYHF